MRRPRQRESSASPPSSKPAASKRWSRVVRSAQRTRRLLVSDCAICWRLALALSRALFALGHMRLEGSSKAEDRNGVSKASHPSNLSRRRLRCSAPLERGVWPGFAETARDGGPGLQDRLHEGAGERASRPPA